MKRTILLALVLFLCLSTVSCGSADKKENAHRANLNVTEVDYNPYYRECMKRITDPAAVAYLNGRGISIETAKACYLGYDPKSDPAGKGYPTARIILPTPSASRSPIGPLR